MAFTEAVEFMIKEDSTMVIGENGQPSLSLDGLGNNLVGLFFGLVRGKTDEELKKEIQTIIDGGNIEEIKNLFLLSFQTRWCRGGKGEKHLFYVMFIKLYETYPEVCLELLELVPQYGYWKDFRLLHLEYFLNCREDVRLFLKMIDIIEKQLRVDIKELEEAKGRLPKVSLLGKYYSPKKCYSREKKTITRKSKIDNLFFESLAKRLYITEEEPSQSTINYAQMTLRKKLVALRRILDITEVKMCANKWEEINFSRVASLCLSRNTRAFLDEDKEGNIKHPDNAGRQLCRQNLIKTLTEKELKGGQLYPNELVEKVFNEKPSVAVCAVINSQWENLVKNIQEQIIKRIAETGNTNFNLTRCVVMSDVSGSMSGTPMMVSIAFGILVSQLTHDAFRDLVLTFDTDPVFHSLKDKRNFVEKVESLKDAPWGGSTNFEGAMNLIIDIVEKNKLSEDEIPQSLLVVSDMQFNKAVGLRSRRRGSGWGTAYDNIKEMFKALGLRMYGREVSPPQIIFWNVRENTVGYPAGADEEGVTLLSGYSPSLLKFIFSGELEEEVEVVDEKGQVKKVKVRLSPKETLEKILKEEGLNPVREILDKYFSQ